jgi:hypothetical protein
MMATENPMSYSEFTHTYQTELGESKKVKLMYTSDFLKSFDRTPKSNMLSLEDPGARPKDLQVEKLREKLEAKDEQIQQLRQLIFKLKDMITERKDEDLIKRMNEAFNLNEDVKQLLSPTAYKIPPLRLPDEQRIESTSPPSPTTPLSQQPQTPTSQIGKSPRRKVEISPNGPATSAISPPVTPSATAIPVAAIPTTPTGAQGAKQVTVKSPRRTPSSSKLNIQPPASSSSSTTTATNNNSPAPTSQLLNPPANRSMKRSPSMPVINNSNNISERQRQDVQAQLKLNKKTKSTEDVNLDAKVKKLSLAESKQFNKSTESISPRKGIKKSVSMSAICMDNDKSAALKCTSLEEIVGQIYPLTKYQAGCRFLQKKLEEQPDQQHVTLVFNEVFDHLIELMTDPYGQYLVPKLMKHCDAKQRQAIVTKIAPKIVTFACHTYGIHGVQKILEYLTDDQVAMFVDVIRPSVIQLSKDNKGNYLIQSFLKQFPPDRNQFIYEAIIAHCVDVATHKVGCTLVNRCIDYANETQLDTLITGIASHCLDLVQDQFGNYVVQHILSTKASFAPKIIHGLLGHIPELSVQKFSSNVIEKCLQVSVSSSPDLYSAIIKEITDADLLSLLQDRYANFVIQTALDVADDSQHAKLVKLILPYIHQIKTPYVMHIQKKILQV